MAFDHSTFKRVFEESGFTKSELAKLFGVSRQTIYSWYDNIAPKQAGLTTKVNIYSTAIVATIDKGVLPLRVVDKNIREKYLQKIATKLHELAAPKSK